MATNYLPSRSINIVQPLVSYADNSVQVSAASTADYTTFGQNWTQTSAPTANWYAIAASANGQYLAACVYGGALYNSINYGQTFTASSTVGTTALNWSAISISSSGQFQVATVAGGAIWYSNTYGATWTASVTAGTTTNNWSAVAISASGQYAVAAVNGGSIYYSSNNGVTWTITPGTTGLTWTGIAISASGNYVSACVGLATAGTSGSGALYYSSNFGQTFTASTTVGTTANTWTTIAMSASGQNQTAAITGGTIWYSSTFGQTWASSGTPNNTWKSISMSASGLYGLVTTNASVTTVNTLLYNYRFNTTDILGTQLLDFASGLYDAFLVNGASISTANKQVGSGGLSLTSSASQYVVLPPFQMTAAIQTTGLTFAAWIKPTTANSNGIIFQMSQTNLANGYITGSGTGYVITLALTNGVLYYYLALSTSSSVTTSGNFNYSVAISTSAWTHIALVLTNGSAPAIYINGSAVTVSVTGNNQSIPLPTYLGGVYPYLYVGGPVNPSIPGYTGYFNGYLDEFRFYTSSLTAAQVSAVWNGGSGIVGVLEYTTNMGQTWTATTGIHANYQAVTMSANGQFLAGCVQGGGIFTSLVASAAVSTSSSLTVSGNTSTALTTYQDGSASLTANAVVDYSTFAANWAPQVTTAGQWTAIASSSNGQYLAACINGGSIYTSANYGTTWNISANTSALAWSAIAVSASGQYQVAAVTSGSLYFSGNYGVTWASSGLTGAAWSAIAISASGQYAMAAVNGGLIWVSSNNGTTWSSVASGISSSAWSSIAVSASGQYAAAAINGGYIWVSSNYGVTWSQSSSQSLNWSSVALSASGQYATAAVGSTTVTGFLYYSANYGASWFQTGSANIWKSVALSASGQYQVATTNFPSLIYNYRFNAGDVQGVALLDYATGSYDATLFGGATISTSSVKVGTGALALTSASSQYAALPSFTMTASYTGLTFAAWVYVNSTTTNNSRIFGIAGQTKNTSGYITSGAGFEYVYDICYLSSGALALSALKNSTSATSVVGSQSVSINTNTWMHIAWILTASGWTFYINGSSVALSGSAPTTPFPPTTFNSGVYPYVYIGTSTFPTGSPYIGGYSPYFTGIIDDFRMYSTALTASQITAIYNSGAGLLGTLQYSNNFGQSWQSTTGLQANYSAIAMSSTGQNLVGCLNNTVAGGVYGSVTSNGPMATSGNMTVGGVLTAPVQSYADGSATVSAAQPLDYTTFGQNWTAVGGLSSSAVWYGCAVSATGQYQTVNIASTSGTIWYSWNYGQTWTQATITANQNYGPVCMSASGQYQVCGINNASTGTIYISSNYGQTWAVVSGGPTGGWYSFCVSASGQYMSGSINTGSSSIYYSTNYGLTWTQATCTAAIYIGICCSASGQYQSACASSNYIYTSSNYGQTWIQSSSISAGWNSICCSASGQYQSACISTGLIYYSSNYGQTWTASNAASAAYNSISCSASGQYQIAGGASTILYSTNYGVTWTSATTSYSIQRITMSANGQYGLGVVNGGAVYQSVTRSPSLFSSGSIILGNSANTQNQPQLVYNQVGAGSTTNYAAAGFLSNVNTLCWTANGNVGIGITNPSTIFHIYGGASPTAFTISNSANTSGMNIGIAYLAGQYSVNAAAGDTIIRSMNGNLYLQSSGLNTQLICNSNGNVGIGITNPGYKLDIYNNTSSLSNTDAVGLRINCITTTAGYPKTYGLWVDATGSDDGNYAAIFNTGNVGIGTTNPQYTLDVAGSARVSGGFSSINGSFGTGTGSGQTTVTLGNMQAYILYVRSISNANAASTTFNAVFIISIDNTSTMFSSTLVNNTQGGYTSGITISYSGTTLTIGYNQLNQGFGPFYYSLLRISG